ncbi:hypothetical protein MJN31_12730, partial [Salmonella enterica subsp. enterica serovar Cerro]|nr:hypothetical protein [Salmonella enterica subsp. enterica serovar Cerro]
FGNILWQTRAAMDRLVGHKLAKGRPSHTLLKPGDTVDSWKVMTTAGANIIGGYVANLMAVPSDVTDPLMSLEVYGRVFMQIGIATAVIAVLMLLTAPKLNRMTQDDDTAEKGSKAATV